MYRLSESNPRYRQLKSQFYESWKTTNRTPDIREIFLVDWDQLAESHRGQRFHAYLERSGGKEGCRTLFHGTQKSCNIGEQGCDYLRRCDRPCCGLCGILRNCFKVSRSHPGLFGRGIYTTATSSKADSFSRNQRGSSSIYTVLVCLVISSRPQYIRLPCTGRVVPDRGYDSVEAVLLGEGGVVQYPETIVYRDDAIVPVAVITYERLEFPRSRP